MTVFVCLAGLALFSNINGGVSLVVSFYFQMAYYRRRYGAGINASAARGGFRSFKFRNLPSRAHGNNFGRYRRYRRKPAGFRAGSGRRRFGGSRADSATTAVAKADVLSSPLKGVS